MIASEELMTASNPRPWRSQVASALRKSAMAGSVVVMSLGLSATGLSASASPVVAPASATVNAAAKAGAFPQMKVGDAGSDVTALQHLLHGADSKIKIDSVYGAETKSAVTAYQKGAGLVADGLAGPKTLTKLTGSLKSGDQGERVKALQVLLVKNGAIMAVDGDFGSLTKTSVIAFQKKFGLTADGVVSSSTWSTLMSTGTTGAVTPEVMITRAKSWLTAIDGHQVPYSQTAFHNGYRTDCSGYVSMTLGLGKPGLNTVGLTGSNVTHRINTADLKKGDLLIDADGTNVTRHVVIFESWKVKGESYNAYEQRGSYGTDHSVRSYGLTSGSEFKAYRPNVLGQ